ncbi:MAG: sialidase [Ferruginibacter sp.]|uniref:sialidase family protein n=1 Tax=Ferruginibacter sp. TaxID=1940288 RepID=UPI002659C893|nr:sialidase family protein [Ferruginibacter sp.]MDB5278312.1 sialidase [Ferruginibacter sp.]
MTKYFLTTAFCFTAFCSIFGQARWRVLLSEMIVQNPVFQECHASTIAEVAPGKLMASFFAGTGEGEKDVAIWLATCDHGKWTTPAVIADGIINDTLRYPCWNPVLFKSKDGKLFLFYKEGPRPFNWWGMVKTSDDNGVTWSLPERLATGILGPIKNKPVQMVDGTIFSPSSKEENDVWKVYIEKSTDKGNSWQLIPVDTGNAFRVIQPTILLYPHQRLQMLCRSNQDKIVQSWSNNNGQTWSKFSLTQLPNPNSGIDAVTLKGGVQMLVYNPATKGKEWSNGRQKLHVAISKDGLNWKDIIVLENGTSEEFSYPAIIETTDGKVHITYTYDRKNIKHVVLAYK